MSLSAATVVHQFRYEQKTYWRNLAGVFFTIGLPILMLSIFITLNEDSTGLASNRAFGDDFVPGMLSFGVISTAYGNLSGRLVVRREYGLLKRARAAPIGAGAIVAGMVANAMLIAAIVSATVLAVGRVAYDVPLPSDWLLAAGALVVGGGAFAAVGMAVASFVPNVEAADPIAFGTILPLAFISGVFSPVPEGSMLDRIAELFPAKHLYEAALAASGADVARPWLHLVVVAGWGVAGAVVAVRNFRWEPRR